MCARRGALQRMLLLSSKLLPSALCPLPSAVPTPPPPNRDRLLYQRFKICLVTLT